MGTTPEELISECEDFDIDISVGPEETPLVLDFMHELQNQSADEQMLIQVYSVLFLSAFVYQKTVFSLNDMLHWAIINRILVESHKP